MSCNLPTAQHRLEVGQGFCKLCFCGLQVGSTPQLQRLRLETSTGLSWIQCQTCTNCFQQPEDLPVFDPTASETYSAIGCDNTICSSDWGFGGGVTLSCVEVDDSNSTCGYSLTYVDGSSTSGTLALDSVGLDEIGNGKHVPGPHPVSMH